MGFTPISGGGGAESIIEALKERGVEIRDTLVSVSKGVQIDASLTVGEDATFQGEITHKGIESSPFAPLDSYNEMTYNDNSNPPMEMESGALNLFANIASGSSGVGFGEEVEILLPPADPSDGVQVAAAADGLRAIDNEAMQFFANDRGAGRVNGQFTSWTTVGYSFWYYNPDDDSWWLV